MKQIFKFTIKMALFAVALVVSHALLAAVAGGAVLMDIPATPTDTSVEGGVEGEGASIDNTKEASEELLTEDIDQSILRVAPAQFPLDQLTRKVGGKQVKSLKYKYYKRDYRPFYDTVDTGCTEDTAVKTNTILPSNPTMWSVDDSILVQGKTGADGNPLMLNVSAKASDGTLTVFAVNAPLGSVYTDFPYVPTVEAGDVITRIGNSTSEADMQTAPFSVMPTPSFQYLQAFMTQVEETEWRKIHAKEVKDGFAEYELAQVMDHRSKIEMAMWFQSAVTGAADGDIVDPTDNDTKYFMRGINSQVEQEIEVGAGGVPIFSESDFVDMTKAIFTGNAGSPNRYMFGGSSIIQNLHKVDSVQKQINGGKSTFVKYGVTFRNIETNFGNLRVLYHPLFDFAGFSSKAIVLDMNQLKKINYLKSKITDLDLKKSGQRNVNAKVIQEVTAAYLRYPETHYRIVPKA